MKRNIDEANLLYRILYIENIFFSIIPKDIPGPITPLTFISISRNSLSIPQ